MSYIAGDRLTSYISHKTVGLVFLESPQFLAPLRSQYWDPSSAQFFEAYIRTQISGCFLERFHQLFRRWKLAYAADLSGDTEG
jgi:hypothetical protein